MANNKRESVLNAVRESVLNAVKGVQPRKKKGMPLMPPTSMPFKAPKYLPARPAQPMMTPLPTDMKMRTPMPTKMKPGRLLSPKMKTPGHADILTNLEGINNTKPLPDQEISSEDYLKSKRRDQMMKKMRTYSKGVNSA